MNTTFKNIIENEANELLQVAKYIKGSQVKQIINLITNSSKKNIFFTGCGTSAMAAKKIIHSFQVIDFPAFYINPSDAVHGAIGSIKKEDIIFMISKGGNTKELTSFVNNLKDKQVKIVAITENPDSYIAQNADYIVEMPKVKEPDKFNMLATASTLSVISLFDSIIISAMNQLQFTKESFLINHPSGDVGARLNEEIGPTS
ncbi:sugar isomerase [Tetragenococcus halophilus subsp. flandriensis]|uniref:KpsF/GutQ family sugar-phosphate isomerase n=1 Tax=Tetragenococcus halophilus TaxID=51669 RepID=UPI0023EA1DF2|nr:SIS domain-containing protein [Tetragenococcus halophilus]GMA07798.1 sugar isomerase [Tetragenococcus halophilus subsp. flandriensis]